MVHMYTCGQNTSTHKIILIKKYLNRHSVGTAQHLEGKPRKNNGQGPGVGGRALVAHIQWDFTLANGRDPISEQRDSLRFWVDMNGSHHFS